MKYLILILLCPFFSCSNKKSQIVEQIKVFKDSCKVYDLKILQLSIDESYKYEQLFWTNGEVDGNKVRDLSVRKEYLSYKNKNYIDSFSLEFKKSAFKNKIDSLELELKKY
jgi:hypothetical protein